MTDYRVIVTREGKWWMVHVPEIEGLTQARRLEETSKMAREYIAVTLDVPLSRVSVSVSVIDVDGVNVTAELERIEGERAEAEAARARAAEGTRRLARTLASKDVPVRDIGAILGVSYQRAHQLTG